MARMRPSPIAARSDGFSCGWAGVDWADVQFGTAMNLFDHAREKQIEKEKPLAVRLRTLDEYVGQGLSRCRGGCCGGPSQRTDCPR